MVEKLQVQLVELTIKRGCAKAARSMYGLGTKAARDPVEVDVTLGAFGGRPFEVEAREAGLRQVEAKEVRLVD